jgi:thioredoxin-dependent peroxiredoxin
MVAKMLNSLKLGDMAPDFEAATSQGRISFHDWLGDAWCVFFSHPKDFTPVCTTELGYAAKIQKEFEKRGVKIIGLSVGTIQDHKLWILDINETQKTKVNYPLIADSDAKIADLYGMIHPNVNDTATVRNVFIIDPNKKIRLIMSYPMSTGRNFDEILRVIDAMQLTDKHKVSTPVNWKNGDDCIIQNTVTDPEELKRLFPKGYKTIKSYLRITPQP